MRGVEMRMAYDYCLNPAFTFNKVYSRLVDESHEVPEYVSMFRLKQDSALADAELFACRGAGCEAGGEFGGREGRGGYVVYAGVMSVGFEGVFLEGKSFG